MEAAGIGYRIEDGILRITFDRPGERVNLLTAGILRALDAWLDEASRRTDLVGISFHSDKPGMFIAGMDVEAIAAVGDPRTATDASRFGQAVFRKIAEAGLPSVCAINGTCLGGGTELALACTFRTAADDPDLRIGLPEVQIGIIPGFGGTQRLPRLVGLPAAADLILSGRRIDGRRARKIGLVDRLVPAAYLERESLALLRRARERGVAATVRAERRPRPLLWRVIERVAPLRHRVLDRARREAASKADPRHYPAPFRALDAIEAAFARPETEGFDLEARIVGELIPTETTRNLIWLFKTQNALKSPASRPQAAPRRVQRTAVVGAGVMGGAIAQLLADHELSVRLKDIRYDAILTALQTAHAVWDREVRRGKMSRRELEQAMAWIAPTLDDTGLGHLDLVVEAVVENLEVKQRVLAELEPRLAARTVFASNTSSLPIRDIAARALRPERIVGMHFFNPVHRMPLVEIIAGPRSSPESVATVHALAVRLGKVPVIVQDGPGFLVNRILTMYIDESLRLLREGVRIDAADAAMTSFGMPMGPFTLLDQIGLDTARHVAAVLRGAFGERAAGDGGLLDRMVEAGRLGQKNGRGFYRYRDGRRAGPDPAVYELAGSPTVRDLPAETLQERMVLIMVGEATRCLAEQVVREPRDVDVAMVMGTGFPPFRGGLLRHADAVGIPIVVDRLSRLADAQGERFRPTEPLVRMVREQARFYPGTGRFETALSGVAGGRNPL